jgi:hypothetical protein
VGAEEWALPAGALAGLRRTDEGPAEAQHYRGGYGGHYYGGGRYYGHGRDNGGAAIAAGVVGLALGAALASNNHGYYGHNYYSRSYYAPDYYDYDYPAYQTCVTTRWVWDPYIGRRVPVRERYAC